MSAAPGQLPPHVQRSFERLTQLQEMLNNVVARKQQFELQLKEIERALEELNKAPDDAVIYKSVGGLLVRIPKSQAVSELNDLKETVELHVKTLSRQENMLRKQVEELRKKLQEELRRAGGGA